MIKENFLRRILYTGAGFTILVAALLTLLIIPCIILDKSPNAAPGAAAIATLVVALLHLVILYSFREAIIANKKKGHVEIALFIVPGIGLLALGLALMDAAFAFMDHVNMRFVSIAMFICIGIDFFSAVIAFTALFLQPKKTDIK